MKDGRSGGARYLGRQKVSEKYHRGDTELPENSRFTDKWQGREKEDEERTGMRLQEIGAANRCFEQEVGS